MGTGPVQGVKLRVRAAWRAGARVAWPGACVLTYHRVDGGELDPWKIVVSRERFFDQLRIIASEYEPATIADVVAAVDAGSVRGRMVAVTFDDGYADNLQAAAPIAAELGVPIHIFVTIRPILDGGRFWWDELTASILAPIARPSNVELDGERFPLDTDGARLETYRTLRRRLKHAAPEARERLLAAITEACPPGDVDVGRPLTRPELAELAARTGVTIGAHTLSHPCLADLAPDDQEAELRDSRTALEALIARPVDSVAYPYGKSDDIDTQTPTRAKAAGYRSAFTTVAGPVTRRSSCFNLPRLTVHDWSSDDFRLRLRAILGG